MQAGDELQKAYPEWAKKDALPGHGLAGESRHGNKEIYHTVS